MVPSALLTTTCHIFGFTSFIRMLAGSPCNLSSATRHAAKSSQSPNPIRAVSLGSCQISEPTCSRLYRTPEAYNGRCGFAAKSLIHRRACKSASTCRTFGSASTVKVGRIWRMLLSDGFDDAAQNKEDFFTNCQWGTLEFDADDDGHTRRSHIKVQHVVRGLLAKQLNWNRIRSCLLHL